MGRVITLDSSGTQRQRMRRTVAEALHLLARKSELDDEARDLSAVIVLALREVSRTVESSAAVWDKRGYYLKAEALRKDWAWAARTADRMGKLIRVGDWVRLPVVLADLAPRFADVRVAKITRSAEVWRGAYERLKSEKDG